MTKISVINFSLVDNHPYVKAVANLSMEGLYLRGLRLEERERGELTVGYPGRKVQGQWQVVPKRTHHGPIGEAAKQMQGRL